MWDAWPGQRNHDLCDDCVPSHETEESVLRVEAESWKNMCQQNAVLLLKARGELAIKDAENERLGISMRAWKIRAESAEATVERLHAANEEAEVLLAQQRTAISDLLQLIRGVDDEANNVQLDIAKLLRKHHLETT